MAQLRGDRPRHPPDTEATPGPEKVDRWRRDTENSPSRYSRLAAGFLAGHCLGHELSREVEMGAYVPHLFNP